VFLNHPFLLATPKEFQTSGLKKRPRRRVFGKWHAHMPGFAFPAIFHHLRVISFGVVWSRNPKKWENPEMSTVNTGFRRALLYI
jgi:hypothetical protein